MKKSPALLVMAAGMGSRYGSLKQLARVGPAGETLMDYSVYDALRAGFGRVVFVIRPEMEADFREVVLGRYPPRVRASLVFQRLEDLPAGFTVPPGREKPWGTGHAVFCARQEISEPFAVINADDFYGCEGYRLLAEHLADPSVSGNECAMCGFLLGNTLSEHGSVSRGVCRIGPGGILAGIREHPRIEKTAAGPLSRLPGGEALRLSPREVVSMNMWGFRPSIFEGLEALFASFLERAREEPGREFYIPEAVGSLADSGRLRVRVLPTGERWLGVTYREDLDGAVAGVSALVRAGVYPSALFPGE